jgi:hypothetical protein
MPVAMEDRMKLSRASRPFNWLPLAAALCVAVCVTAASGCTSVISSAYLREAWLDAVEHAAEPTPVPDDDKAARKRSAATAEAGSSDGGADSRNDVTEVSTAAAWSPASLDEAVGEADQRLAQVGGLTAAARSTLIATLKSTPRQDWQVVVEEFTAALAAAHPGNDVSASDAEASTAAAPRAVPDVVAALPVAPAPAPVIAAEPIAPLPPAASSDSPAPEAVHQTVHQTATSDHAAPAFAVQNACFASRVQGWGLVDRFETAAFSPGQDLIVYFELDQLTARDSSDGHTTRIDTVLRLVGGDGRRLHEWTFEPLEETCRSQRRDYFARYLVTVPASTPAGSCRLEVVVSDTIAGRTAQATLPLDVTGR